MLDKVGLTAAADRRVKGYSMGMRQRLAIAAALLGDPEVLILDEPANGLDPPGIRWMRDLIRAEAARGRTVLVSSHLLSEVAQSVGRPCRDRARLAARERPARAAARRRGRAGDARAARTTPSSSPRRCASGAFRSSPTAPAPCSCAARRPRLVGAVAAEHGVPLSELVAVSRSLEDAFLDLTEEHS